MTTLYRSDRWVQDALGNAVAGASVAFCSQPANTTTTPPSPLIPLYADSGGVTPITNPLTTDGLGHAYAYMAAGTYTVVSYGTGILTVAQTDQIIASYGAPNYKNDGSTTGTITGAINGTNTVFNLSATPNPASSLLFAVNGLLQTGYVLSGNTVTLAVAPHSGDTLNAIYTY